MDVVELAKELIDIHSETLNDGEVNVAKYLSDFLEDLGFSPELIRFNSNNANVIASVGSGEGLMLNGHMDTVPWGDPSLWEHGTSAAVVGDKLYGRGASDMKGGLASMLAAVANLDIARKNPKRRLLITLVAGEEVDFRGSTYLLDNRSEIFKGVKYGMIAEPTFSNSEMRMQVAQKGAMNIEMKFKGKAAHASRPWLGDNAILKAVRFIEEYQKLAEGFSVSDELLGKGTINIGVISGGTAPNVVPDFCKLNVDRRLVPGETVKGALDQVRSVLAKLGISADISTPVAREAFRVEKSSKILEMVRRAAGGSIKEFGATGYTEAELYKAKAGIDSVVFGPGELEMAHQANECVPIESLKKAEHVYENLLNEWCI